MRPFLKQILSLMFQRLSSSKTTKFVCGLIVFIGFYSLKYGPTNLIENLDSAQPKYTFFDCFKFIYACYYVY